jgi:hypothetical protein
MLMFLPSRKPAALNPSMKAACVPGNAPSDALQAEAQHHWLSPAEAIRHEASLRAHGLVREGLITNGLRYAIMSFGKRQ